MADETFKLEKPQLQREGGVEFKGNMPPQLKAAWEEAQRNKKLEESLTEKPTPVHTPAPATNFVPDKISQNPGSANFPSNDLMQNVLAKLQKNSEIYTKIELPSKGKFYNGDDGPKNGILHIRPMTGAEELILTTNRLVKQGKAVDMIFKKCMQEHYPTEHFLTADRHYLLIWLRGISYGNDYEVEIKCPACAFKFNEVIDLDLPVNYCPDTFNEPFVDTLPVSKLKFTYKLSRGVDETSAEDHRNRHLKMFGDNGLLDDTIHYKTAVLVKDIEGVSDQTLIVDILKKLPIQDVSYLRNTVNDIPFGVNTKIDIECQKCWESFDVELPLDANFFFPRNKKKAT